MEEYGEGIEDGDDESWNLPFSDETSHIIPSTDIGSPGSRANTQDWKHSKQRLPCDSGDLSISTLGHTRTLIHIDIDCFYAQVEMMRNPKLRDKPLGVQQKYLVVTCNYVARECGVTKLMAVKEALDRCPDLVLVSGEDLTHYRQVSYRISDYPPAICTCGCRERLTIGSQISADIRDALYQELDITCCAGISYNKLLSKLVAGKHKPNQQTTLFPEQTAQFMATVGQVRRIPGIGSTTSKKLAALGIVSLQDLQQSNLSDLKQELGPKQSVIIQQLSFGVDDSHVITFGRPQTLSDEDSFKKCSTVKDTRSKVRELLSSLTKRLLDDGRTPQTLRLTIRKLTTADKKWTNRESRQCPIPGHVMLSLCSDKLGKLIDQLEEITMTLFTKLVNTKEPFHLTLMNIAFCSLVEKSKNAISSFFTIKSPRNNVDNGCSAENSQTQRKSVTMSKKGKQPNVLQKWVIKSPEKPRNLNLQQNFTATCEESSTNVSRSLQSCLGVQGHAVLSTVLGDGETSVGRESEQTSDHVDNDSEELKALSCQKRKAEERIDDRRLHIKKRSLGKNIDVSMSGTSPDRKDSYIPGTSEVLPSIPSDLDMEIFLQLPQDIQREILQEAESRQGKMCSTQKGKNVQYEQTNSSTKVQSCAGDNEGSYPYDNGGEKKKKESATISPTISVRKSSFPSAINSDQTEEMKWTDNRMEDFSNKQTTSILTSSDFKISVPEKVSKTASEPSRNISKVTVNSVDCSATKVWKESGYLAAGNDNSVNQSYQLPPHIDIEVFSNLPADIQKEYIGQWSKDALLPSSKGKQPVTKHNTTPTTSKGRQPVAKQKHNEGKSILSFFQTKNKK
ncbi:DNA polymerase iota-like isoform X2 [Pecten maximus]|uniref:DNA polymerase iota-like isoform X2 n=1 Tax=Pecten maximus TaxID=6579 RepID=UPI0014589884|nr:DNA polymerase iota-like isoform X2 [Pecten maximus]